MPSTYEAILHDGRLEWGAMGLPAQLVDVTVPVRVTVLSPRKQLPKSGIAMADALAAIAASGGPASIVDPVAWQRETRLDRSLPGRSE